MADNFAKRDRLDGDSVGHDFLDGGRLVEKSVATPKRRKCYASNWARRSTQPPEMDPNEGPLTQALATAATQHTQPQRDMDLEFEQQFEAARSFDTAPRWKCSVDIGEFERRCYQFPNFVGNRSLSPIGSSVSSSPLGSHCPANKAAS